MLLGEAGVLNPIFLLSTSFSWVHLRLHTEYQVVMLTGSALIAYVLVGVWWWVVLKGSVVIVFRWNLALATPNNEKKFLTIKINIEKRSDEHSIFSCKK